MGYNWASAFAVALLVCAAPAHADSISIVASGTIPSGCTVGKTSDFGTAILTASGTVTAGALVDCNTPFLIRSTSAKGAIKNTAAASAVLSPSMIETFVNGRSVERRSFQPGNYTLQDFPVAEGSNTVKLRIEDASGKLRTVDFSVYANQSLLGTGVTEFALFGGVHSAPTQRGIAYSRNWIATGFVRRGMTEQLTAGVNFQANRRVQQVGAEALWGSPIGLTGFSLTAGRQRQWRLADLRRHQPRTRVRLADGQCQPADQSGRDRRSANRRLAEAGHAAYRCAFAGQCSLRLGLRRWQFRRGPAGIGGLRHRPPASQPGRQAGLS